MREAQKMKDGEILKKAETAGSKLAKRIYENSIKREKLMKFSKAELIDELIEKSEALAMKEGQESVKIPKNAILLDKDDLEFQKLRDKIKFQKERTDEILKLIDEIDKEHKDFCFKGIFDCMKCEICKELRRKILELGEKK